MSDDYNESIYHIPKQNKPLVKDMGASVSVYPPLGQVTQVQKETVQVTALLEVPHDRADQPWEVALWHAAGDQDWAETRLSKSSANQVPSTLQEVDDRLSRLWFNGHVCVKSLLKFTLKFRPAPDQEWKWIRDEQGTEDATVILNSDTTAASLPGDFDAVPLLQGYDRALKVTACRSQCPGTKLWALDAQVDAANGEDSTYKYVNLGLPWGGFLRWFSLVRIWTPWLAPRQGRAKFELDQDGVVAAFLNSRGHHLVLLAVSGVTNVMAVLQNDDAGNVKLHLRNDADKEETGTVLAAVSHDFESANAAVMQHARSLVTASNKSTGEYDDEMEALREGVKPEWMENWYDGLGFCTWNALGQKLTAEKVLHAVDELAKHKVNITSLIIDDNWQDLDYQGEGQFQHGWNDFEAEPKAFPLGLKDTVHKIRTRHPSIQHVAVWHALLGYWGGLSPDGALAKKYKTQRVAREDRERRNLPLGGKMTVVAKEDVQRFYNDFYTFLASCGIDGVKTDAQFLTDTWISAKHRRELITEYLDAWTIASLRHFSIKAISCMSQTPTILFHSQLPRNKPAILVRNSDDFFPEISSSHPWHVWANAHNSLFTQHLNVLPDWDMFQTVHDYSAFHAAARCVSGGPIYITDVPGEHNLDLISQMTAKTVRGKTVILRPSVLGRSIDQYVGYHDEALLQVASYHGDAATGTPIVGVFNVSTRPLTSIVPLARIPGARAAAAYVVRAHTTGRLAPAAAALAVTLAPGGFEILTAHPLAAFAGARLGRVLVASLGLLGKMAGAAAVVRGGEARREHGRVVVGASLRALGVLGVYVSALARMDVGADVTATIHGRAVPPHTVAVSKSSPEVLEVDVEAAWEELQLEPGWGNEIELKVYFKID